jgi:hypothetical protein
MHEPLGSAKSMIGLTNQAPETEEGSKAAQDAFPELARAPDHMGR